ncbi:MAG: universal stress protein [Alphaproteobacteria bacterium]
MGIKQILVPLTGHLPSRETLVAGLDLAQRFGARLNAVHVRYDPATAVAYAGAGAAGIGAGAGMEMILQAAEEEAAERERRARALFDEVAAGRAEAHLHVVAGAEAELIASYARLSDLILFPRPGEGVSSSTERDIEAALFESGRPVYLVPPAAPTVTEHPGTVVIAWNDSPEAARALDAGLPFLAGAARALVLSVGDAAPTAVCDYLAAHGIAAEALAIASESSGLFDDPTGGLILQTCAEQGAGLLVMGAFTHMRIRQMVIAGATRTVMSQAPIPVMMRH